MVFTVLQITPMGALEVICVCWYTDQFRTGNPTGTYQNGYDSTQQYGSNVPNMHNGMNQQAYAYPATAAAPMIGYPMPTGYSQ